MKQQYSMMKHLLDPRTVRSVYPWEKGHLMHITAEIFNAHENF